MMLGECERIIYAATAAPHSDSRLIDPGLSNQVVIGRLEISRPLLVQLLQNIRGRSLETRPAALTEATIVDSQRVDAFLREFLRDRLPRLPGRVAHVQQENSGSGLGSGEQGSA